MNKDNITRRMIAQEIAKNSANTHEMLSAMLVWFKENIKTEANIKPNDIDLLSQPEKDCLSQATLWSDCSNLWA